MWPVIGSVLLGVRDWFGKVFAASAPQRADFEAVNKFWRELVAELKQRMDERDAQYKADRAHDRRRIADLEREAEECHHFREANMAETESLRQEVVALRAEVARLKAAVK